MTKKLDPEIKALRAIARALATLGEEAQWRIARWVWERYS